MNLSLGNVFERIETRQQQALIALARNSSRSGPFLSPKNHETVQMVARRTSVVLHRLKRLRDKLEKYPGDKAYIDLPEQFLLEDVERKVGIEVEQDEPLPPSPPPIKNSRTRPDSEDTHDNDNSHTSESRKTR